MEKVEFDFDLPNISDILEEKVQINTIFHFSLVQKVFEEFIKRQNLMNQKLNSLEIKFDSWSLSHGIGGDTENTNNINIKTDETNKENINEKDNENNGDNQNNEGIDLKIKGLTKKIKKLESINKEMAQRLVENNNQNSENISKFVETSEDKIKQMYSSFKSLENNINQKERVINNQTNKMNQLLKKIETMESDLEENKKSIKNINKEVSNLQRLKLEDLVTEFNKYKNQNDLVTKELKNLIDEKITQFKNNLLGKKAQNLEDPNTKVDIASSIDEIQLRDMANELKNYFSKNITETNKSLRKLIEDMNIHKINQDISNIQKELKEKLSQKNIIEINNRMEEIENRLIKLKSECSDNNQAFDYLKENASKVDKNIEFLTMQIHSLSQNERENEKKSSGLINEEGNKLFIKKDIYEEDMTKILKKMEKIFIFQQEYVSKIDTIEKKMKLFVSDKELKNIEHFTLNMIQEFKINAVKKFMDKKEGLKSLKLLGLQIKNIIDFLNLNNTPAATDRIMMNNAINNYLCPSCDNKLNIPKMNKNNTIEHLPSKNRDKNELKNYRMGQGFSHMLQLINSDLMKSAEKINDDFGTKIDDNINYNFNEKENHNRSSIENNKSLPRLNSQKSFSIINAETKNNDLDTSNINISAHYNNESTMKNIKNNSIDKILSDNHDLKNKIFKKIERISPWKNSKNQIVYTKMKKLK